MQKYQNAIQDVKGNAIAGAFINVYLYGTLTTATIYSDNGVTPITPGSLTTDSEGEFGFYAANGRYTVSVTATGFTSQQFYDVLLFDPADAGIVSVKNYGAVGDGVTDDTIAINAALSAIYFTSQSLCFPAGIYLYSGGGVLGNGNVIYGDGRNASIIKSKTASPTSGWLIKCLGYGSGIRSLGFQASVTQTAGSYVWLSGTESFIDDFDMDGDFNGILMTGSVSRILHGRFTNGAAGAIRIKAEGGDNSQLIEDVLMGAQLPQISSAGIRVRNSSALIISNTSVIQQGHALLIDPTTNTQSSNTADGSVYSVYVNNCFFDNSSGNGIRIAPTGTANVVRCRFSNVWASSSTLDGVLISNSGTGIVSGMHFESPHLVLNTSSGLALGGTVSDIAVIGGEICQNSYGVYVNNTATNLKVLSATIGAGAGLNGNTNNGIVFGAGASASNNIVIADNVMTGNGGSAIDASSVTGFAISIYGNIGADINTWSPAITFATPGNLSVTYSAQSGSYTRVGNLVTATFVVATSAFTHTTASGALRITGLPFVSAVTTAEGALEFQGITKAGYTNCTLNVATGNSFMTIRASGSGVAIADVLAADMPSGGTVTLRGSITYMA